MSANERSYRRRHFTSEEHKQGAFLFGEGEREEFALLESELKGLFQSTGIEVQSLRLQNRPIEKISEELDACLHTCNALIVVLLQSYPGEYTPPFLRALRIALPLTPILLIAGDLCEGELRTGNLPRGIIRFYRYQWKERIQPELKQFLLRRRGRVAFPAMASDEDYFSSRSFQPAETIAFAQLIPDAVPSALLFPGVQNEESLQNQFPATAIIAPADQAMGDLLAAWRRKKGESSEQFTIDSLLSAGKKRSGFPKLILIDLLNATGKEIFPQIEKLTQTFPESRIALLLVAPRLEDEKIFRAFPKVQLISKPFI